MNPDYLIESLISNGELTQEEFDDLVRHYEEKSPLSSFVTKIKSPDELYEQVYNNPNSTLEDVKSAKIEVLRKQCEESILSGFKATVREVEYEFSFDIESQMNFSGALQFFGGGFLAEIQWTVKHNGEYQRILLNQEEFMSVVQEAFHIKNEKISKFRDFLCVLVNESLSKDELLDINW